MIDVVLARCSEPAYLSQYETKDMIFKLAQSIKSGSLSDPELMFSSRKAKEYSEEYVDARIKVVAENIQNKLIFLEEKI